MINKVLKKVEEYFEWEKDFDFSGWQDIQIYTGTTLSEAWIKARPNDSYKFEDVEFKNDVDKASGKWLEKQFPEDSYKVLLKMIDSDDPGEQAVVLVHELRHCLDYINAVNNLSFEEYSLGNQLFVNWSEFRATMVSFKCQFFQRLTANNNQFEVLASLLGVWTADTMQGIFRATDNQKELYFLCRYMGAARAARNLSERLVHARAFSLWHLIPLTIYEKYGIVFYVANELEEINVCRLNQIGGYYFQSLVDRIDSEESQCSKDCK